MLDVVRLSGEGSYEAVEYPHLTDFSKGTMVGSSYVLYIQTPYQQRAYKLLEPKDVDRRMT
jgi:hypothetical protein